LPRAAPGSAARLPRLPALLAALLGLAILAWLLWLLRERYLAGEPPLGACPTLVDLTEEIDELAQGLAGFGSYRHDSSLVKGAAMPAGRHLHGKRTASILREADIATVIGPRGR
jgi:hypothetical protein